MKKILSVAFLITAGIASANAQGLPLA